MNSRAFIPLALMLTLAAAGCSAPATPDATPVVSVQVAPVRQAPLEQWIRTQAVLYPRRQAVITPKIAAPITHLYVQRGDRVHAGELLATLESRDLAAALHKAQAQLVSAQAAYTTATAGTIPAVLKAAQLNVTATQKMLANAQQVYTNRQNLFQQGAIPRQQLEQAGIALTNAQNAQMLAQQHLAALTSGGNSAAIAEAQGTLDSAQADLAAAQATLDYASITSPIDGVVTDRPVYTGELASPSAPIMTIMDTSQVVARASLPVRQAELFKVGDQATITPLEAGPARSARVTVVSPATDPNSTTMQVWCQTANPGDRLQPGSSVNVAIRARTLPHAVVVPASAVLIDNSGAASVMVAGSDGKAHQTDVTLGVVQPGEDQILKGVKPGQRVVTVGAYGLPDGAQIQIQAPSTAATQNPAS
ncbi:MAG TPA: efflux RND transporter periplasmic adaptor subunit [Terriglobales bacterium]|nr:efflux RND transporter periplasmic adaptor subunit [Terriglobales bacterium]